MGVDAAAFAETMEKWNGYVEAKNDPDFGRTSFANPLDTAPYYAVKVTAGVHHTMGGLKINANTEVLNEKGEVIPGQMCIRDRDKIIRDTRNVPQRTLRVSFLHKNRK